MSTELSESELGTLEYWDERYKEEIGNFKSHGDVGEIWFGDDITERIMKWMMKNVQKSASIVDVGCGNGMMLVELAQTGYSDLTGIDYSENAIKLSEEIMRENKLKYELVQFDILKNDSLPHSYDVFIDKGTFDAISLMKHAATNKQLYVENVHKHLKPGGFLVITSCNWTESELDEQFNQKFVLRYVIPTPQFKFGGKIGSVVSSVVFEKKY